MATKRRQGRTAANPGRANINIGAFIPAGGAEGDATPNPAFQNSGQVDFNYKGMPEDSAQYNQPVIANQGFLQKLRGQPSLGQQVNAKYAGDMALARGNIALEKGEAPEFNPSFFFKDQNPNGQLPSYNSGSGDNTVSRLLPAQGSSLGSQKLNSEYVSHLATERAQTEAAIAKERGMLGARGELEPGITLKNALAAKGLNPNYSGLYAQSNEAPFLAGNRAATSGANVQNEENLGNEGNAQNIAQLRSDKALNDAFAGSIGSGTDDYMKAFVSDMMNKLATTGLTNQKLSDINLGPADTLIRNGQQFTGMTPQSEQFQNTMKDPKSGISIPFGPIQTKHSYLPPSVSSFGIPAKSFDTSPPKNSTPVPTDTGTTQGPLATPNPFNLDLNLKGMPTPTNGAPNPNANVPARGMSPTSWTEWPNLLLQEYMRVKKALDENLQAQ